jgi:hypothetical protein
MCVEAGTSLSSVGFEMAGGAPDCWVDTDSKSPIGGEEDWRIAVSAAEIC